MKKVRKLVVVTAIAAMLLGGCGNGFRKEETDFCIEKFYYNQLSEETKKVYDKMESSSEEFIENETILIASVYTSNNIEETGEIIGEILYEALYAYKLDNPISSLWLNDYSFTLRQSTDENGEFYIWMSPGKSGSYSQFENAEQLRESIEEIENKTARFVKKLSGTNEKKLRKIHDWILEDSEYSDSLELEHVHDLYGALIQKKCVCDAYSYAFKYVADMARIPVITVTGIAGEEINEEDMDENHAWNHMYIGDEWYLADLTWNLESKPVKMFRGIDICLEDGFFGEWTIVLKYEICGFETGYLYFKVPLEETTDTHRPTEIFDVN